MRQQVRQGAETAQQLTRQLEEEQQATASLAGRLRGMERELTELRTLKQAAYTQPPHPALAALAEHPAQPPPGSRGSQRRVSTPSPDLVNKWQL